MWTIYIDDAPYQVPEGQNLLHACLSLGFDLPYFCWHPAMHSVGACRQCAVKLFKDPQDKKGKIVMACMTMAADGARISIDDPEAKKARRGIIELLMTNHPHDCPVCDEGGECHLQDMTVMTGHTYRRFRFNKRTHRDQYLGPFIHCEMNRCIQCYRCVRFYREAAGGRDFEVLGWHNHVYFGRHRDGVLQSPFSGNLVEVCPTGVFTDKVFREHYTRKWDLQTAPSVCVHCGIGCNTIPGERYGIIRRIRNRYNRQINGYWLCDRGRYGYSFVNDSRRIRRPLARTMKGGDPVAVGRDEALARGAEFLQEPGRAVGIGSPRADLEANFALRTLVGPDRFFSGFCETEALLVPAMLRALRSSPADTPCLHDVGSADAVIVLGEDLLNTAPMMACAVRQAGIQKEVLCARKMHIPFWNDAAVREACRRGRGPLFVATPDTTGLDEWAGKVFRAAPDDLARLGFAIAHALNSAAPAPDDLSDEIQALAESAARMLREAERAVIITGPSCGSEALIHAAANIARALTAASRPAGLSFVMPECNSFGLAMMEGRTLDGASRLFREGAADTLVILENDLYRRGPKKDVDALLSSARHVVAIDHLTNATTARADLVLPAATFAEGDGTLVNHEGRAQRYLKVLTAEDGIQDAWRWLRDLMIAAGRLPGGAWPTLDAVISATAEAMPVFEAVPGIAPPSIFRIAGNKIPRQPHRYSGRTAMYANVDVHEPKPPDDMDSPLSFSMEGHEGRPPAPLIPRYWAPGWNSVQAVNKYQQEVGGLLHGGDVGHRLLEPSPPQAGDYFDDIPAAFQKRADEWLVIPLYHVHGSEELSALAPGVAELAPSPDLALNAQDMQTIGVTEGQEVQLSLGNQVHRLPVRLRPALPAGVAGLPVGLRGHPMIPLPAWGRVKPSRDFSSGGRQ